MQGYKQGKWTVHVDPLRGNPGYEEEGLFKNDFKEGLWKQFNLMGDKMAEENYKGGNKKWPLFVFHGCRAGTGRKLAGTFRCAQDV